MAEAAAVRDAVEPFEILLVADAMTGQDAVNVAEGFKTRLPLTGTEFGGPCSNGAVG